MKYLLIFFPFYYCLASTLDHFIDEIAPRRVAKAYKYDRRVTDLFETELAKWTEYHKENPSFPLNALVETFVEVAEEEKGHFEKDSDKTPFILYQLELCKILWDEGNIRYGELLQGAFRYKSSLKKRNDRVSITLDEIETNKHLSIDAKILLLAHNIYHLRNKKEFTLKKGKEDLQETTMMLYQMHGVHPLLEKKLLEEITKAKN